MTESDAVWAEVARRAVSRFSGVTVEDDDVLRGAEIVEAALNPNKQGANPGGAGGGGMMPPMMMGGQGGGGAAGGAAGSAGLGSGAGAVLPQGTMPQQATVGMGVRAAEAPRADPVEEELEVPGIGAGGMGGGPAGGALPEAAGAGTGAARDGAVQPVDGFAADPQALRTLASRWADVAQQLHGLEAPAVDATLGVVLPPERPQQAVHQQVEQWTTGAASEFDAIVARLHDVASQYEEVEASGVAEIRKDTTDD